MEQKGGGVQVVLWASAQEKLVPVGLEPGCFFCVFMCASMTVDGSTGGGGGGGGAVKTV